MKIIPEQTPRPHAGMRRTLFAAFLRMTRNRLFPRGKISAKSVLVMGFGILLVIALYMVSVKVVGYFHQQNELGIILSTKIFNMVWIIMFSMLLISTMVSGVSGLFLSNDNEIIYSAPVRPRELFFVRYCTLGFYASWMMFVFSLPVFAAYGRVFKVDLTYWPLMLVAVIGTIATASGIGLLLTIILVRVFPAKRTKEIVLYLSLCFGLFIYFMFRLMRPEDLVNPLMYPEFIEYLSAISRPAGPYLPPAWAGNLLSGYLLDRRIDWLLAGLLVTTGPAVFFMGEWAMDRWFQRGYSKAQESFGGYRSFVRRRAYRPSAVRWVFGKEARAFFRDSSEWSQLFMIAALVLVYLYNFKVLPVDRSFIREEYLTNLLSFLNIGLAGFVITSLSARFVYPSVGAEGGAFTFVRSAPLSMGRFLAYKYLFYVIPFTAVALILTVVSGRFLHLEGPMRWISVVTVLLVTWTVIALALGFGACYADYKAENRAARLGSMGAVMFLFTAIAYQLAIVLLGAYPAYRAVASWLKGTGLGAGDAAALATWTLASLAASGILVLFSFLKGKSALENPLS